LCDVLLTVKGRSKLRPYGYFFAELRLRSS
jgi:hypothetical protein